MVSKARPKPAVHILPMHIEYIDLPPMRRVVGTVRVTIGPHSANSLTRTGQIIRYTPESPQPTTDTKPPFTDLHLQWPTAWPTAIASQMNKATEAHIIRTWMAFRHFYLYARGRTRG